MFGKQKICPKFVGIFAIKIRDNRIQLHLKSDNLQYNTLGRWVDRLIDQASDGPSIILID